MTVLIRFLHAKAFPLVSSVLAVFSVPFAVALSMGPPDVHTMPPSCTGAQVGTAQALFAQ